MSLEEKSLNSFFFMEFYTIGVLVHFLDSDSFNVRVSYVWARCIFIDNIL